MVHIDPFKFVQEVRAEAQKVTWPTRKETTVTTMMVFVMVILATIFFHVQVEGTFERQHLRDGSTFHNVLGATRIIALPR